MKKLILASLICLAACQTPNSAPTQLEQKKANLRKIATTEKTKGNYSIASTLESQIIGLDVSDPESFINLSQTLHKQDRKPEALDILQTGEKLMPENEKIRLYVAIEMIENGEPEDGLAKLNTIKTLRDKDYYNAFGVANDLLSKHDIAQNAFKDGLKIAPDDGLLQNNLALSYILSREYDKAITILKDLVKRKDTKPKYRHNLALAYGMSGKYEEANKVLSTDLSRKQAEENIKAYKQMRTDKSE